MAKCPVCKNAVLQSVQLDNQLRVMECKKCNGSWIRSNDYAFWLKSQTPGSFDPSKVEDENNHFPVSESSLAAICPDCGRFLRKYKVGPKTDFHLDRCNSCNGVWLDHNEWRRLEAADLHDEINQIFTRPWQEQIQSKAIADKLNAAYMQKFGPGDYAKIKEIREWLQGSPNRNTLLAFLLDKDPYSS